MMKAEKLNIVIDADVNPAIKEIRKLERSMNKPNYRKLLYIFLLPLLIIEWVSVLIFNIWEAVTNSIKELTLSLEKVINANIEPPKSKPPK